MFKKCKKEKCDRPAEVRGYCHNHYVVELRSGRLEKFPLKRINEGICKKENCNKKAVCGGFCDKHYHEMKAKEHPCKVNGCNEWGKYKDGYCERHHYRFLHWGTTDDPIKNKDKVCKIKNCNNKVYSLNLCKLHYDRQQSKKYKQRLRNEGRCIRCTKLKDKDGDYCSVCTELYRQEHQDRKNKLIEKGLCAYCGQNEATIFYVHHFGKKKKSRKPICADCYFRRSAYHATGSEINTESLKDLWEKQKGKCFYTGLLMTLGEDTSVDHIIPRSCNGSNDISNLCWCLWQVNQMKNDLTSEEFITFCKQATEHHDQKCMKELPIEDWRQDYKQYEAYP